MKKTEDETEQGGTSADSERIQSTRSASNQYSNKTKAKVHFGACSIGALTFGVLAGPVGLVFAPAYLNAICMAMYGGNEFLIGETPPHQTEPETANPEPEQPTSASHTPHSSDQPGGPENEEEEEPQNNDTPPDPFPPHGKGGNFTFAPVYAPNITINEAPNITINGNIYFMQAGETAMPSQATSAKEDLRQPAKSSDVSTSCQSEQVRVTRISKLTPEKVSKAVDTTDSILQTLTSGELNAHQFSFSDGAQAIVTGLPAPMSPVHHRGKGFTAFNEASVTQSQTSYEKEKAKHSDIKVGVTHSWQCGDNGQWSLKPLSNQDKEDVKKPDNETTSAKEDLTQAAKSSDVSTSYQSEKARVTGLPAPMSPVHHRGKGFTAFNEASVTQSQTSYEKEKAKHSDIKVGGTHSWQCGDNGQWSLKPLSNQDKEDVKKPDNEKTSGYLSVISDSVGVRNRTILENSTSTEQRTDKGANSVENRQPILPTGQASESHATKAEFQYNRGVRDGSQWKRDTKGQCEGGAQVILSPGSAQAISGFHSNRTVGLFNNMSPITLKTRENANNNQLLRSSRQLKLFGNIPFPQLDPTNLVFESKAGG
ncbi:hypothetical protein FMH16_04340 [Vibrio vulnificus]|nr:hypothetical protein [Vibrio vulnificus]MCU8498744.1 hypothetical protein [Vibrio vulnificus]